MIRNYILCSDISEAGNKCPYSTSEIDSKLTDEMFIECIIAVADGNGYDLENNETINSGFIYELESHFDFYCYYTE